MNRLLTITLFTFISLQSLHATSSNTNGTQPDDSYIIDVKFSLIEDCSEHVFEQLLTITESNGMLYSIIFEYSQNNGIYLSYISKDKVMREKDTYSDNISFDDTLSYTIVIDKSRNRCVINREESSIVFDNMSLFSNNLKFNSFSDNGCVRLYAFNVNKIDNRQKRGSEIIWLIGIIILDILVFFYIHRQNKKRDKEEKEAKEQKVTVKHKEFINRQKDDNYDISLFGTFKVTSKDGVDISGKFSPILKELLLLLICNKKGISSSSLKEILWYDKSEKSANNNRSVYFNKLRSILSEIGNSEIVGQNGYWKLEVSDISIDYYTFLSILEKGIVSKNDIRKLLLIVEKGQFITDLDAEWLDPIKSEVSDYVVTILSSYITGLNIKDETNLIIQICDTLFTFDILSEIALEYKCKALKEIGKHTLVKQLYTNYAKEYLALYGEEYSKSFSEIMVD